MKPYRKMLARPEQVRTWAVRFDGGEDITSPVLDVEPGDLLLSKNYEASVNGGYQRCGVFERYDGRANRPSTASYHKLKFDQGSTEFGDGDIVTGGTSGATGQVMISYALAFTNGVSPFMVGETVTGATTGATGVVTWVDLTSGSWNGTDAAGVLYIRAPSGTFQVGEKLSTNYGLATSGGSQSSTFILDSGSWVGGDAAGDLFLCKVSGTFLDNEDLEVGAVAYAVANGVANENGAENDLDSNRYLQHAIQCVRSDIGAVTGSGAVQVMALGGTVYAIRNNAGGTAAALWKATASGWASVSLPAYIDFDNGSGAFAVGDTVTGATSGASATIDAIIIKSGTTGGGNQTGRLYLSGVTGGPFTDGENLQVSAATKATADGINGTLTLSPNSKLEYVVDNFTGASTDRKIYGVTGVDPAFEFDGTNFYHLVTANTVDKPTHVAVHKNYLFLAFGSSVQHSGLGEPRDFSAISGAVEIATGDTVTGFAKAPGDILVLFSRGKTYTLYGSVSTEWERKEHAAESGAIEWSVQSMGRPIYLDDRGLMTLESVNAFGDFKEGTVSKKVDPVLQNLKNTVISSVRVKDKNQYRVFFADGTGMHVRFDRKQPAFTRVDYGKVVRSITSTEDSNGDEVIYFGSDDGYVYQLDVGLSADGGVVEALARFPFWNINSPRQFKKFTEVVVYVRGSNNAYLQYTPEFDYSSSEKPAGLMKEINAPAAGGIWGSAIWGQFVWGGPTVGETVALVDGAGANLGLLIRSISGHEPNHTLESAIVHYIPRGLKR